MEAIVRLLGIEMLQFYAHARGNIALFVQKFTDTPLKELALIFRIDLSTLSKAIVRLQKKRLLD